MKEGFSSLYTRLYNENKTELEALRLKSKEEASKFFIGMGIAFVVFFVLAATGLGLFLIPVVVIGMIILIVKGAMNGKVKDSPMYLYRKLFKEKIIIPLITNIFEGATYKPEQGWSKEEYKEGEYERWFDRYKSEDLITSPIKLNEKVDATIEFCEVHTERESRDKDGNTSYTTIFHGIASKMKIDKSLGTNIYIDRNWMGGGKSEVKLDSPEFEKKFDVRSEDKIMAVRVLTADVMAEMVDMREKYGYSFEIHIIRDTIYMRVFTGSVFEPNIYKEALEYQTLEKYYKIIHAMMSLSTHIYNVIDEIVI